MVGCVVEPQTLPGEPPASLRAQAAPPLKLQARPTGFAPGCGPVYYQQSPFVYAVPFYMAAGRGLHSDSRGPRGTGTPGSPHSSLQEQPQQHEAPVTTMDALKTRIMEAGPGQVKKTLAAAQFVPRAAAFTSLIQMAAKAKHPQKAIEIFDAMTAVNAQPNTFSYSALISALARGGRWQEAERYFRELEVQAERNPALTPNTVTYAALISAYEKGGQLDKALAAFQQQQERGTPPDIITYSSLITACERAGDVDKAGELLDQLHDAGLVGNHQLYHGLLSACQVAGRWQLAIEIFLGMQCATLRPTVHTVNLLLGVLAAAGQTSHALWLLREAVKAQYDIGAATYNAVLQLLAAEGDWQRAMALYKAMGLQKVRPDSTSAGLLVAACMQGSNQQLAAEKAAELQQQGLLKPPPPPAANGHGRANGGGHNGVQTHIQHTKRSGGGGSSSVSVGTQEG